MNVNFVEFSPEQTEFFISIEISILIIMISVVLGYVTS